MNQGINPRTLRVRKALMNEAFELASKKPITDFTLTEVAKNAGVSRPTLYKHFDDVPTLVADTAIYKIMNSLDEIEERLIDYDEDDYLVAFIKEFVKSLYADRTFYVHVMTGPSVWIFHASIIPELVKRVRMSTLVTHLSEEHGQAQFFCEAVIGGMLWNVSTWLQSDFTGPNDPDNFGELLSLNLYALSYVPDKVSSLYRELETKSQQ